MTHTEHFNLSKGRPGVPRIANENLDIIDENLADALAFPYVPDADKTKPAIGIKSLEVGPGLILRDQGENNPLDRGQFIIEIDRAALTALLLAKEPEGTLIDSQVIQHPDTPIPEGILAKRIRATAFEASKPDDTPIDWEDTPDGNGAPSRK